MQAYTNLRNIWYIDSSTLSPIPEIPNSATISPELSPEPIQVTSQSTKILSLKPKRPKKPEKRDLNIRIDKKLQRPKNSSKKPEKSRNAEIDSMDIYKKSKKEVLKLISEVPKGKFTLYVSPERPETSRHTKKSVSKRTSVPRLNEESKQSEKFPKILSKHSEPKLKPIKKSKFILAPLSPLKPKPNSSKLLEETSLEVQRLTNQLSNKLLPT